jgi:RimJ/RimL family protein N-acetyltransferase
MELRPWRTGDEALLASAQPDISPASLTARFCAGLAALPAVYLRHVTEAPRERWDAQVATDADRLVGWAEFARLVAHEDEADLAVLVVDAWQRRGVATALFRAMLPRAVAAGVRVVHADVEPRNAAARATIQSLASGLTVSGLFIDGLLHYRMAL